MEPGVLPTTVSGCRERRRQLELELSQAKTEIAANDIRRQLSGDPVDPEWFACIRAAIVTKRQELLAVIDRQSELSVGRGRNGFRDAVIETLRADYNDDEWAKIIAVARGQFETDSLAEKDLG